MQYTEKLGLKKPELTDYVNIEDLNENMDILDGEVGELKEGSTVIEELETENKTLAGAINEVKTDLDEHKADYASHITAQERISWNDTQENINAHADRKSSKTEYGHVKIGGSAISITDGVVSLEIIARPSDENLVASAPKEVFESSSLTNPIFTQVKEVRINDTGIIRVKYDLRTTKNDATALGDIRINGVSVGDADRNMTTSYVTQTHDIEVQEGDSVELWLKPIAKTATAYARNFNIYYTIGLPLPDVSSPNIILN